MSFIPAENVVQVEMVFNWNTQIVENVHHFHCDSGPSLLDMPSLLDSCRLAWSNAIRTLTAPTVSLVSMKASDLTDQHSFTFTTAVNLPMAGTSASPSLPNNCACVVTKRTALRGRSYRGRTYVPGLTEAVVTDNLITSTFLTGAQGYITGMSTFTISGRTYTLGVLSRYLNNAPRLTGSIDPVISATASSTVASQRRRLPGRGA